MDTTHRITQLDPVECLALLATVEVGRVVFTDRALPAILPVAFVVDGAGVALRTARGSRLARAAAGAVLAFEADEVHPATGDGWSVVVTGGAALVEDAGERDRLDRLLRPWVPGLNDAFIRIPFDVVTGRQVRGRPLLRTAR